MLIKVQYNLKIYISQSNTRQQHLNSWSEKYLLISVSVSKHDTRWQHYQQNNFCCNNFNCFIFLCFPSFKIIIGTLVNTNQDPLEGRLSFSQRYIFPTWKTGHNKAHQTISILCLNSFDCPIRNTNDLFAVLSQVVVWVIRPIVSRKDLGLQVGCPPWGSF